MTMRVHTARWPRAMATCLPLRDHVAIVVVGDKSQIQSGLAALHEGPIVERDMWGRNK
ncbi:MAG TPA: hypothetical protein VEH83_06015 [Gemmatimonadales bacterium]|nr:hypothetical protein [Gemmatimonadales bacterium]